MPVFRFRSLHCFVLFASTLIATGLRLAAQSAPASTSPAPAPAATKPPAFQPTPEMLAIQAASDKEHQRVMSELGIKRLRPPVDNTQDSPNPVNYDESKANVYKTLPDPLVMNDGTPVTTASQWWNKRRPEIVELFDREMYGRMPANLPHVKWELVSTTHDKKGDVPIVTKKLIGHTDNSADPDIKVELELELSMPEGAKGPVPVVMELGFSKEFLEMLKKRFPQLAAGEKGPTWQQQVLALGWGYAEYVPVSAQPDSAGEMTKGIIGLVNKGKPRKLDDWSVLKAWAWGAGRCLDYFESDKAVDAKQVAIAGHSRYGKASLVAMAYDPRWATGYISSSGQSGAKLSRHIFGEQVENQAGAAAFHWVDGNFLKYAGPLTTGDLPIDQHELIALVAPRPVFISGGNFEGDGWADPKGMFLAASAAGPVYRLLGKKDLGTTEFPPIETALIDGDIGYRQHRGGHTPGPNWPTFLTFASRYLHVPGQSPAQSKSSTSAPVHLTAAEDRERLLGLLGLKDSQMRPPPAGDARAANATNYEQAKANVYPNLPDPLLLKNGQRITHEDQWWSQRRPEIVADFEHEILGRAPANLPAVRWEVVSITPEKYGGVDAVTKHLLGHVDNSQAPQISVNIDLLLITPAKSPGPVPVILELAFAKDFQRELARPLPEPPPPGTTGEWGVDGRAALALGWGFAVLNPVSFQADDGSGPKEGIIGLMNKGQPRGLDDWGTLRAWAWGASRALDYMESDPSIDARQVGIEGHSRFGKTALVAMAFDQRFAICYSSSSGEGGAKLYRHIFGEQMPNLASSSLYHWFDGNFLRYGGPLTPKDLPVDAHELIALSAPRPVFIGGGSNSGDGYTNPGGDAWADPDGMFLAEVAAGPVYRLLGAKDLETTEIPPVETAIATGDLAFRQHPFGHTPAPNWPAFLDFASHYLHAPVSAPVLADRNQ